MNADEGPGGKPAGQPARKPDHDVLLGALLAVTLPFLLDFDGGSGSRVTLAGWRLPEACLSRLLWHVPCPGCGLTRSLVRVAHGDLVGAWRQHRVGPILYLFCLLQVVFRVWLLFRPAAFWQGTWQRINHRAAWGMLALFLVNWLARLLERAGG